MKKVFPIFAVMFMLLSMTSCYHTEYVSSYSDYLERMNNVEVSLNKNGYELSGKERDERNNVYVSAISYSTETGYGTAMNNDYITTDKYTFTDSVGDKMSFNIDYRLRLSYDSVLYVESVSVPQCATSNPKKYYMLCGPESPIYSIKNLPVDTEVKIYDEGGTLVLIYLIGSLLGLGLCMLLL